jgi:hypothetical protein
MARQAQWPPPVYHAKSNQARVVVWKDGRRREFALGEYGSPEARREYARRLTELETGPEAALGPPAGGRAVADLVLAYLRHMKPVADRRDYARIVRALDPAQALHGHLAVTAFGPLALKAVRKVRVGDSLAHRDCNRLATAVRACFRWGVSEELVPVAGRQAAGPPGVQEQEALLGSQGQGRGRHLDQGPAPGRLPQVGQLKSLVLGMPGAVACLLARELRGQAWHAPASPRR